MSSKNSKIEEFYMHFSKSEKEGITQFLKSELFHKTDVLLKVHEYLSELKTAEDIDKLSLYRYIYGNSSKYSDVKLRVYLTKLSKLIEKYLVIKQLDSYPLAELNLLTRYYNRHHLHKNMSVFFNSKHEYEFDNYEEFLLYEYHYAALKLDFIHHEYTSDGDRLKSQYDMMMDAQKKLYLFQTLRTQCHFLSLAQKYSIQRDNSFEEGVILSIAQSELNQDPVFRAYLIVYELISQNNHEKFMDLKQIIFESSISNYPANIRALLTHYQNFCIKFINSGQGSYLSHLLESYKFSLKFYKNPGDLDSPNFRNIVYCALQLKELNWAEEFVENYHDKVSLNEKGNAYNFNLARISFEKGDYRQAMKLLLRVSYEDAFYASSARILLIKCYYETNDEMPLLSYCASLIQFLNRSKEFTSQRKENNLHFIQFTKSLQTSRLKNSKKFHENLRIKIQSSTTVEKEWLLQKINELIE